MNISQNVSHMIGSVLRKERTRRGFSLNETANTLMEWGVDCSRTTLGRIENGAPASFPIVDGYLKLFGWKYSELDKRINPDEDFEVIEQPIIQRKKTNAPHFGRELSVLSWIQAGNWDESPYIDNEQQEKQFVSGKLPK
ncbi:helix-turn-helix domain-containing protein, partial [Vibrio zhanjiangensis]|uniref:helix-turn-helix domain-containing protein n=1 Tax=Vibrio zhanjiangensis TaxID=1046128 RepID=UPI0024E0F117